MGWRIRVVHTTGYSYETPVAPHTELAVTATSVVETADALAPPRSATWEELAGEEVRDRYTEMLGFTDYVERNRDLGRAARALRRGKEPADAALGSR